MGAIENRWVFAFEGVVVFGKAEDTATVKMKMPTLYLSEVGPEFDLGRRIGRHCTRIGPRDSSVGGVALAALSSLNLQPLMGLIA